MMDCTFGPAAGLAAPRTANPSFCCCQRHFTTGDVAKEDGSATALPSKSLVTRARISLELPMKPNVHTQADPRVEFLTPSHYTEVLSQHQVFRILRTSRIPCSRLRLCSLDVDEAFVLADTNVERAAEAVGCTGDTAAMAWDKGAELDNKGLVCHYILGLVDVGIRYKSRGVANTIEAGVLTFTESSTERRTFATGWPTRGIFSRIPAFMIKASSKFWVAWLN